MQSDVVPDSRLQDALLGSLKNSAAFGGLKQKLSKLDQKGLTLAKPAAAVHVKKATRSVVRQL